MSTVTRRTFLSTPGRDALQPWTAIVDLLTHGKTGSARSELLAVGGVAASVIAEYRRGKTIRRSASTRPAGQIITVTGAVISQQEMQERERLFSRIRRGDKKAATELWETRRAWVMRGGGKGVVGREGAQRDEARRSVAHEGAAAPSLTKEAT